MIIPRSVLLLKSQISEDGQDKYEALLKGENFEVTQAKTLSFNYKNLPKLKEKLANPGAYSGLVLSSPRCVQAVQLSVENGDLLGPWKGKNNYVVGEATCRAAVAQLCLNCTGKEAGNAENLSKVIVQNRPLHCEPFLFPHGNLKTDTLTLELGKEGLEIDGVEVYDTVANPDLEQDLARVTNNFQSIMEFVVFFSPSGFNSCIDLIRRIPVDLNQVKFIAIGPVTELAMKEGDLRVHATATRPNPEELLNVILK